MREKPVGMTPVEWWVVQIFLYSSVIAGIAMFVFFCYLLSKE